MVRVLTNGLRIRQRKNEGLGSLQYLSGLCKVSDISIFWDDITYVVHCTLEELIEWTDDDWVIE